MSKEEEEQEWRSKWKINANETDNVSADVNT
jgi:hypothetical protein